MKTKQILLTIFIIGLGHSFVFADSLTNNLTNRIRKIGDYSMMRGTNGHYVFVNPSEFWNGIWKEDTNGWRVQLRIYPEANYWYPPKGFGHPISTNLMLRVEWGSAVKNSGDGYYMAPNGKFSRFEVLDSKGNIVPPNPNSGTNLLERVLDGYDGGLKLTYETNLPAWVAPLGGSLVANFQKIISINVYPYVEYMDVGKIGHDIMGQTGSVTNRPPFYIGLLKLGEIYSVTNAGDYTLTVQPVLYKKRTETNILDRVDLPSVTTKVHLVPNAK